MVDDPEPDDSVLVALDALVVPLAAVSASASASACIVPTRAKTRPPPA
ncbi:hypothetical protein ABT086_34110 [Streptomyces mirabilis]